MLTPTRIQGVTTAHVAALTARGVRVLPPCEAAAPAAHADAMADVADIVDAALQMLTADDAIKEAAATEIEQAAGVGASRLHPDSARSK